MVPLSLKYRKLVLVCTNLKEGGKECCAMKGGVELHAALKLAMAAHDPSVRVSKSGCLGRCVDGGSVVIMPDNLWFGGVTQNDIPALIAAVGPAPVQEDTDADFLVLTA
jgi:(2Fe-2S) ferredoxin